MNALQPFVSVAEFVRKWLTTREWRCLAYSIPAFVVAGTIVVSFAAYRSSSSTNRRATVVREAEAALQAKDYQYAEFLYRKAQRFDPKSQSLKYWQAIALDRLEKKDAAAIAMNKLASLDPDKRGYPKAHMWMARSLASGRVKVKETVDVNRLIASHLQAVVQAEPENLTARKNLAMLGIRANDAGIVLEYLPTVLDEMPEQRIVYARALNFVKRATDAKTQAELATDYYEQTFGKSDVKHSPQFFIDWADAHAINAEYEIARQKIYDGLLYSKKHGTDNALLLEAGSNVIIGWTRYLQATDSDSIGKQMKLLSEALKMAPDNARVLTRIAQLSKVRGTAATAAMESLKQAVDDGSAPPEAHFILGTQAALMGADFEDAKQHFETAIRLSPNAVEPINNLAWIIAHAEEPRLETALKLVDRAKELVSRSETFHPSHVEVYDTRGHILILMQRYEEGISELEHALRFKKNHLSLHEALALAYEKTDQPEMAKIHADKVAEIQKASEEKPSRQ